MKSDIIKKCTVAVLGLGAMGVFAHSGESQKVASASVEKSLSFCEALARGPVLYEDKDSFIRKFKLMMTGQYQFGTVSPSGRNRYKHDSGGHNSEWRRAYLGFEAVLGDGSWRLVNQNNVGDLEARNTLQDGRWIDNHTQWSIYELYLEKKISGFGKLKLGKVTPHYTSEYSQSSSIIKTVERSAICNELVPLSNWAIEANYQEDKDTLHTFGVYLNANGVNLRDEIQFNSDDNVFAMIGSKWKIDSSIWDEQHWGMEYVHNFANWRGRSVDADSNYQGPGAQDIISVGWDAKVGNLGLMANFLAGMGIQGKEGAKNVWGGVFQATYRVCDHVELVSQQACAFGKNSVKLYSRYVPSVTSYPSWVDSMYSVYFGANWYLCPESINTVKLMTGVEYITSRAKSGNAYDGWNFYGALRFKF